MNPGKQAHSRKLLKASRASPGLRQGKLLRTNRLNDGRWTDKSCKALAPVVAADADWNQIALEWSASNNNPWRLGQSANKPTRRWIAIDQLVCGPQTKQVMNSYVHLT